jgi:starch phosphorylase
MDDNNFLPQQLIGLSDLAGNFWWSWNEGAQQLFESIDPNLWALTGHNPVRLLQTVSGERMEAISHEAEVVRLYDVVMDAFTSYMHEARHMIVDREYPDLADRPIAYFSMEYGLHQSLPIYAGGLGVLSGDHLKEASDMGLPVMGVGLFYRQGYFSQHIGVDGRQESRSVDLDPRSLPLASIQGEDGEPVTIRINFRDRIVEAQIWKVRVGRVSLYLLDTDVAGNDPEDRAITSRLYQADLDRRISQEIVLGLGGVRALHKLGYEPAVWHMNEGHAAFMVLERIRQRVQQGSNYEAASSDTRSNTVFTTHTPVPAGHDVFPNEMVERYFHGMWEEMSLSREAFMALGMDRAADSFSMSALAMRMSGRLNGVSELHGEESRRMWSDLWPQAEVPIGHVTNGVHTSSWLGVPLLHLFDRHLDPGWWDRLDDPAVWEDIARISDLELWQAHGIQKRQLLDDLQSRTQAIAGKRDLSSEQLAAIGGQLDPQALTIGFARRFTSYKRSTLILSQPERLQALLQQGVQIAFSGKAHPRDKAGQAMIQEIYAMALRPEFSGRLAVLEGYDIALARLLVQGVDLWLNTPRRPNEASGTSGQKAALNGVLNCSVLDGWWPEGFNGQNGWSFGSQHLSDDKKALDKEDAESLYQLLEGEIVPAYYARKGEDDLPIEWIRRMRESIRTLAPQFSSRRMVKEYIERIYSP